VHIEPQACFLKLCFITNIQNAVNTKNSGLGNGDFIREIRHITQMIYGGLLEVKTGKNY
jgi:hypothetical protein